MYVYTYTITHTQAWCSCMCDMTPAYMWLDTEELLKHYNATNSLVLKSYDVRTANMEYGNLNLEYCKGSNSVKPMSMRD